MSQRNKERNRCIRWCDHHTSKKENEFTELYLMVVEVTNGREATVSRAWSLLSISYQYGDNINKSSSEFTVTLLLPSKRYVLSPGNCSAGLQRRAPSCHHQQVISMELRPHNVKIQWHDSVLDDKRANNIKYYIGTTENADSFPYPSKKIVRKCI